LTILFLPLTSTKLMPSVDIIHLGHSQVVVVLCFFLAYIHPQSNGNRVDYSFTKGGWWSGSIIWLVLDRGLPSKIVIGWSLIMCINF